MNGLNFCSFFNPIFLVEWWLVNKEIVNRACMQLYFTIVLFASVTQQECLSLKKKKKKKEGDYLMLWGGTTVHTINCFTLGFKWLRLTAFSVMTTVMFHWMQHWGCGSSSWKEMTRQHTDSMYCKCKGQVIASAIDLVVERL